MIHFHFLAIRMLDSAFLNSCDYSEVDELVFQRVLYILSPLPALFFISWLCAVSACNLISYLLN